MLDIKFVRENPDAVKENIKKKFQDAKLPMVDEVIELDKIRELDAEIGIENLPTDLSELALLRIANPEASLSDLAALSDPPVTKSCINHRLRKLMNFQAE